MKLRHRGFTFIEIIFVIGLLSVVGLSVFLTFSRGLAIWKVMNEELAEEDAALFFEKMTQDLRNCFSFGASAMTGEKESVLFASIISYCDSENTTTKEGIGMVMYQYDSAAQALVRKQADYSQMYRENFENERPLLTNVESVVFQYFYFDTLEKEYRWSESWPAEEELGEAQEDRQAVPIAVKVELTLRTKHGGLGLSRIIYIPTGSMPWQPEVPLA